MPVLAGVQAIRGILGEFPDAKIVVLTHYDGDEQLGAALEAGAFGYLTKEERGETIVEAVRTVARGEKYLAPGIAARLEAVSRRPVFTLREKQVLTHIVSGHSNRQIADELGLSHKTVAIYVGNLLDKLGVANRTEAATVAVARGLVNKPGA